MKKNINKDSKISEIIDQVPEAASILIEKHGIFCVGCPMAQVETLEQGAKSHGLSQKELKKLVKELNLSLDKKNLSTS